MRDVLVSVVVVVVLMASSRGQRRIWRAGEGVHLRLARSLTPHTSCLRICDTIVLYDARMFFVTVL